MGEQGARALRGGANGGRDFRGDIWARGVGRAQVDLTIDNTDGLLDIEYSEVTISRTLFRGGGSEYSLTAPGEVAGRAGASSDTGMGQSDNVIVGQGSSTRSRPRRPRSVAGSSKRPRASQASPAQGPRSGEAGRHGREPRARPGPDERDHRQPLGPRQARVARRVLIQARVRDAKARLLADDLSSALSKLSVLEHRRPSHAGPRSRSRLRAAR